jgi:hypothetical protein
MQVTRFDIQHDVQSAPHVQDVALGGPGQKKLQPGPKGNNRNVRAPSGPVADDLLLVIFQEQLGESFCDQVSRSAIHWVALAVRLGLLEVSTQSGRICVGCRHAHERTTVRQRPIVRRVLDKYAARLAVLCCRLSITDPQVAASLMGHFRQMLWMSFVRSSCRRTVDSFCKVFSLLQILIEADNLDALLMRVLEAATLAGPRWHSKVGLARSCQECMNAGCGDATSTSTILRCSHQFALTGACLLH